MFLVWVMQKTNKIFSNIFKGFVYLDKLYRTVPIGNFFAQQKLKNLVRCLYYSNQKEKQYLVFFKWYFSRYYSLLYFFVFHIQRLFSWNIHIHIVLELHFLKSRKVRFMMYLFGTRSETKKLCETRGGGAILLLQRYSNFFWSIGSIAFSSLCESYDIHCTWPNIVSKVL